MLPHYKVFLFFFLLSHSGIAQQNRATTLQPLLSIDSIFIGQQIRYTLPIANQTFSSKIGKIVFPASDKLTVITEKGVYQKNDSLFYEATITSYDTGSITIPTIIISPTFTIKPISFYVKSVAVDTSGDYRDIKPILQAEKESMPLWYYIAGAGILLAIVLCILLLRQRKRRPSIASPQNKVNAMQEALNQLQQLEQSNLLVLGKYKIYYTALDAILRTYLQAKGITPQSSITNQELKLLLHRANLTATIKTNIQQSLQLSSYVQYAKYQPEQSLCEQALLHYKDAIVNLDKTNQHAV
jgi:hypothetical protein